MNSQRDENTVYVTEQEAERIRSATKSRLKKCAEAKDHAREPRDSKAAIRQATAASLMADMGAPDADSIQSNSQGSNIPTLAVGQPYPPCVVSLQELQPMRLADLKIETHHRGRRLTVKRTSPVVTLLARSWTMVQNEEGDETERLEVCLHKSRHGEDMLESGAIFVIKEPYFTLTEQGEATLRIDHPSDLVIYRDGVTGSIQAPVSREGGHSQGEEAERVARAYKDKGNTALEQLKLPLAHAMYTEGLKTARQDTAFGTYPDLARDLFRNRAHVNLLLNQLDEAIADAKASLTGGEDQRSKDLDSKAYFRAGCAAYNLGSYHESRSFFTEQLKLSPGNKSASVYLRNIEIRLREETTGEYDFKKIRAGLSPSHPRVDATSFISNTKIGDSPGRGRGLFATRDIPADGLVLCEKAFCVVWAHEREALTALTYDVRDDRIRASPVGLTKAVVQALLSNPSQVARVMDLYGDYAGEGAQSNCHSSATENGPVVDVFRVHDIVSRNAFGPGNQFGGGGGGASASAGLWIRDSYVNHSCVANTRKEFVGDMLVLRASRRIAAGEEIFHSYAAPSDLEARQAALMGTWGFECSCALCVAEKADDPALRRKRKQLEDEADAFVAREHWVGAKRLAVVKARRLKRAIEETYDAERYKGLPRLATRRIQEWLELAGER